MFTKTGNGGTHSVPRVVIKEKGGFLNHISILIADREYHVQTK